MRYKVLDTNILLLDASNLVNLGKDGSTVVLPETVLDELDAKKSGHSEIAFQARELGRLLSQASEQATVTRGNLVLTPSTLNGVDITIISLLKYPSYKGIDPKIINDRKIIEVALELAKQHPVTFISNDVMCRIRARALNLKVQDLKHVETTDVSFINEMQVDEEQFKTLHNQFISEVNPSHKPNYFNYRFTSSFTNQQKLATIENGRVQVIGKATEEDLTRQDIKPLNSEQLFFSKALQDTSIDVNICEAKAGTGKTAIAISNGIRLVRKGKYESLIYIRASVDDVDSAEEVGFLSGNEEKMQVYLHPLEDTLDFIARNRHKSSKLKNGDYEEMISNEVIKIKDQCNIQSMIGLGLRGRTFHNAYVIIDEAQNQTAASLQKMLTRIGQNCKLVIIGSNKQIDNSFITKYTNGLGKLLEACTEEHDQVNLHAVSLPTVLRGPIAEFAENLFSRGS